MKYNSFLKTQINGGQDTTGGAVAGASRVINFSSDSIKCMLVGPGYVPSAVNHAVKSSITNEVTGNGYTAGGQVMTGVVVAEMNGQYTLDANDVTWVYTAGGFTNARYAIIYKNTGTANTSTLFLCIDLLSNQNNTSGDFTLHFDDAGIASWI